MSNIIQIAQPEVEEKIKKKSVAKFNVNTGHMDNRIKRRITVKYNLDENIDGDVMRHAINLIKVRRG